MELNLSAIEENPLCTKEVSELELEHLRKGLDDGDVGLLLLHVPNHCKMAFVFDNFIQLKDRGLYEECLLDAYRMANTNLHNWQQSVLEFMFRHADRKILREYGDPIPGKAPYTLYRGVAGKGRARRLRGLSWTSSFDTAKWFAKRFTEFGLENLAVIMAEVPDEYVLAYDNGRNEQEFICLIPDDLKLKHVWKGE